MSIKMLRADHLLALSMISSSTSKRDAKGTPKALVADDAAAKKKRKRVRLPKPEQKLAAQLAMPADQKDALLGALRDVRRMPPGTNYLQWLTPDVVRFVLEPLITARPGAAALADMSARLTQHPRIVDLPMGTNCYSRHRHALAQRLDGELVVLDRTTLDWCTLTVDYKLRPRAADPAGPDPAVASVAARLLHQYDQHLLAVLPSDELIVWHIAARDARVGASRLPLTDAAAPLDDALPAIAPHPVQLETQCTDVWRVDHHSGSLLRLRMRIVRSPNVAEYRKALIEDKPACTRGDQHMVVDALERYTVDGGRVHCELRGLASTRIDSIYQEPLIDNRGRLWLVNCKHKRLTVHIFNLRNGHLLLKTEVAFAAACAGTLHPERCAHLAEPPRDPSDYSFLLDGAGNLVILDRHRVLRVLLGTTLHLHYMARMTHLIQQSNMFVDRNGCLLIVGQESPEAGKLSYWPRRPGLHVFS
jgi:hypothetical protein